MYYYFLSFYSTEILEKYWLSYANPKNFHKLIQIKHKHTHTHTVYKNNKTWLLFKVFLLYCLLHYEKNEKRRKNLVNLMIHNVFFYNPWYKKKYFLILYPYSVIHFFRSLVSPITDIQARLVHNYIWIYTYL